MIRVLIVDDSKVDQMLIEGILSSDPDITIVGIASDGTEAIRSAKRLKPDIITMDVHMPGVDGFSTTRTIMETTPVPIIIVTGIGAPDDLNSSFQAVEAGALHIMKKPPGPGNPEFARFSREFIETIRIFSEVRVVRRFEKSSKEGGEIHQKVPCLSRSSVPEKTIKAVLIGASTGGPLIIQKILKELSPKFPIPILIVQHIATGFVDGFASWLATTTGRNVHVAENKETIIPGEVYIAPCDRHMGIKDGMIQLSDDPPEDSIRPSVGYLFRSAEKMYGNAVIAILLSGMGSDGARDMLLLHDRGAFTIAQDETSSIVFGMPGSAIRLGAAECVLTPCEIGAVLQQCNTKNS
ncbi:MAG: chemotaxis-specific protein-glutamate methyltransferase CheB [Methanospirillaceae archaeon]|nr:chemotaxis-specific protein-glutamate methyltransferase CheB [Methanospirillaceae archaeon]